MRDGWGEGRWEGKGREGGREGETHTHTDREKRGVEGEVEGGREANGGG